MNGKNSLRRRVATAFLLLLGVTACVQTRGLSSHDRQLNVESFDYVWSTIRDKHFDPDLGGLDWEAVRRELRPQVEQARSLNDARDVLADIISRLGQSHFNIIPAELYGELRPDGIGSREGATGIEVRVYDGAALVVDVEDGMPAADVGVRPGWEIIEVAGKKLRPMLDDVAERFAEDSWRDNVLAGAVMGRMRGAPGDDLEVRFLDGDGKGVTLTMTLEKEPGERTRFGMLPPVRVEIESQRLEENIGYVTFSMFLDPVKIMPPYNAAMQEFMDADGIVIDLRGNPGGLPGMVAGMIGWLVEEKNKYLGTMQTRDTELKIVVNPRYETYAGPVAVLIDNLSGSAAEMFSGGLQDLGRARLFGTHTAGAVLPSIIEKLPNGDGFQYAFANYVSFGGDVLEGEGVHPDEQVRPSREDLLAGHDPVLAAAVAWIGAQARGGIPAGTDADRR